MQEPRRLLAQKPRVVVPRLDAHFHVHTWSGPAWPEEADQNDVTSPTPPLRISDWLCKPRSLERARFESPEQVIDWLELIFGTKEFGPRTRLEDTAGRWLQEATVAVIVGRNFLKTYRAVNGEFVALAAIRCPRPGIPCPPKEDEAG